jgi:nitroreductase
MIHERLSDLFINFFLCPSMMNRRGPRNLYIENLEWRYATKKFANKKIPQPDLEILKRVLQLSASSYGLQPYAFLIIEDKNVKAKLYNSANNQNQVKECSHLIVFCSKKQVSEHDIDLHIKNISEMRNIPENSLLNYSYMLKANFKDLSSEVQSNWSAKQAYLALGNLLSACAYLKIDACPIESFDIEKFNTILNLDKVGLKATVLVALGYRSVFDSYQKLTKVRKPFEQLFISL